MTKAILVKWLSAANTKGTRTKATAEGGHSQTVHRDYGLSSEQQDAWTASLLAEKLGWSGVWVLGALPNGDAVFVNIGRTAGQLKELTDHLSAQRLGSWFEVMPKEGQ